MIEELFEDPAEGTAPTMRQLSFLLNAGVPLDAIVAPWCLRVARITFPEPWRYEPSPMGRMGYVLPIIDDGIIDLAGWYPHSDWFGTRLGIGACLGEGQIGRDGLGTTGLPLPVWRSPLSWLNAYRKGVVIADREAAMYRLAGLSLLAEDMKHGRELSDMLTQPLPTILLRREVTARAA